ncbi:MAG: PTS sugar transporter subunit IIA [Brevundimonas sp.]|uniref:PTS sugar transporter subunit IIA n=1 Tax=Brevundimonas sp. TaxID=1871086 RepID=UPI00271B1A64|nr:PTS sugar transporter subunit IIA [Brevundimonas sp.]MDO9589416.1 PTS sugar transporter subunit IIA [Brevundimonas sp.]MDP3371235.1 PTS sugar transporter subunit IIA [Brevundimonas sp.]MDP3656638.1 PTS sugar transporter subunit IIA [Brevundimonas sp.]MDZ4114181.1 PTS sugar transporter subunit IIA [Brevundimonas sp.]
MDISELLADGGVVLRSGASSKRQALHTVAEAAAQVLGLPENRLMEALLEREALGSTGLGSGVAVPHARLEGVERVTAVFVRLETPVAYGAVDDRPVDLLFALFAPPSDGAEHLRALAAVSRALRSSEMREQLRQARTTDAIRALFVRDSLPATAA